MRLFHDATLIALFMVCATVRSATHVGIMGGGLAGLSTAFHLLRRSQKKNLKVTILDPAEIGTGGASAVAAGILHKYNPRFTRTIWRGDEGYDETMSILRETGDAIITDRIIKYHADAREWKAVDGGVVVDVPSYLRNIYEYLSDNYHGQIEHRRVEMGVTVLRPPEFDAFVIAAGFGCFDLCGDFGVTKLRGQSVVLKPSKPLRQPFEAKLFGNYAVPVGSGSVMIGSTLEWFDTPLTNDEVLKELREKTEVYVPELWGEGWVVEKVWGGTRVQSNRSPLGRVPKLRALGDRVYLLTGLGTRGLIYSGMCGRIVADAVLSGDNGEIDKFLK